MWGSGLVSLCEMHGINSHGRSPDERCVRCVCVCVCVCVCARARASNTQRSAPYILADALRCKGRAVRRITMRFASSHPTLIVKGPGSQDSEASQTLCACWEVA